MHYIPHKSTLISLTLGSPHFNIWHLRGLYTCMLQHILQLITDSYRKSKISSIIRTHV